MSLQRGFYDKVYMGSGSGQVELATVGDINYGSSRTDIPVKTRACDKVRTLAGMEDIPISFTIIAGVDPADPNGVDGYALLQAKYKAKEPVPMSFGNEVSDTFTILSFQTTSEVDGLKSAQVSVKPSAEDTSGSGSGT